MSDASFRTDVRMLTERLDLALMTVSRGGTYADLVEEAADVVTGLRVALEPAVGDKGRCGTCLRSFALRSDGSLWAHRTRTGTMRCLGSHKQPA